MTLSPSEREEIRRQVAVAQSTLEAAPSTAGIVPIVIRCRWSSCRHGHHSLDHFQQSANGRGRYPAGCCQECGERVVELPQPGEVMPLDDDQFLDALASFPKELIRAHYWSVPFDLKAYNQALRLGRVRLRERLAVAITTAMTVDDAWATRRAPYNGKVVAYAQHATATCCRRCAAYWHGLSPDMSAPPTERQLQYVIRIAQVYIDVRFPDLPDGPSRVPNVLAADSPSGAEVMELEDRLIDLVASDADPAGLTIPLASQVRFAPRRDQEGGYLEPVNIALPHPGAA